MEGKNRRIDKRMYYVSLVEQRELVDILMLDVCALL